MENNEETFSNPTRGNKENVSSASSGSSDIANMLVSETLERTAGNIGELLQSIAMWQAEAQQQPDSADQTNQKLERQLGKFFAVRRVFAEHRDTLEVTEDSMVPEDDLVPESGQEKAGRKKKGLFKKMKVAFKKCFTRRSHEGKEEQDPMDIMEDSNLRDILATPEPSAAIMDLVEDSQDQGLCVSETPLASDEPEKTTEARPEKGIYQKIKSSLKMRFKSKKDDQATEKQDVDEVKSECSSKVRDSPCPETLSAVASVQSDEVVREEIKPDIIPVPLESEGPEDKAQRSISPEVQPSRSDPTQMSSTETPSQEPDVCEAVSTAASPTEPETTSTEKPGKGFYRKMKSGFKRRFKSKKEDKVTVTQDVEEVRSERVEEIPDSQTCETLSSVASSTSSPVGDDLSSVPLQHVHTVEDNLFSTVRRDSPQMVDVEKVSLDDLFRRMDKATGSTLRIMVSPRAEQQTGKQDLDEVRCSPTRRHQSAEALEVVDVETLECVSSSPSVCPTRDIGDGSQPEPSQVITAWSAREDDEVQESLHVSTVLTPVTPFQDPVSLGDIELEDCEVEETVNMSSPSFLIRPDSSSVPLESAEDTLFVALQRNVSILTSSPTRRRQSGDGLRMTDVEEISAESVVVDTATPRITSICIKVAPYVDVEASEKDEDVSSISSVTSSSPVERRGHRSSFTEKDFVSRDASPSGPDPDLQLTGLKHTMYTIVSDFFDSLAEQRKSHRGVAMDVTDQLGEGLDQEEEQEQDQEVDRMAVQMKDQATSTRSLRYRFLRFCCCVYCEEL